MSVSAFTRVPSRDTWEATQLGSYSTGKLLTWDAADDRVVSCLGRRPAWTRTAEMVFGRTLGPAWPSGRDCSFSLDGSRSETVARPTGQALSGPTRIIRGYLRRP